MCPVSGAWAVLVITLQVRRFDPVGLRARPARRHGRRPGPWTTASAGRASARPGHTDRVATRRGLPSIKALVVLILKGATPRTRRRSGQSRPGVTHAQIQRAQFRWARSQRRD